MSNNFRTDISAPNLTNVCIDSRSEMGSAGRLYSCYSGEQDFTDEFQVLKSMEAMMDKINYPQASTNARGYGEVKTEEKSVPEKVMESTDVISEQGDMATFLIHVKYRQHATWQGEVHWKETETSWSFNSVLELLKIMEKAVGIPVKIAE